MTRQCHILDWQMLLLRYYEQAYCCCAYNVVHKPSLIALYLKLTRMMLSLVCDSLLFVYIFNWHWLWIYQCSPNFNTASNVIDLLNDEHQCYIWMELVYRVYGGGLIFVLWVAVELTLLNLIYARGTYRFVENRRKLLLKVKQTTHVPKQKVYITFSSMFDLYPREANWSIYMCFNISKLVKI